MRSGHWLIFLVILASQAAAGPRYSSRIVETKTGPIRGIILELNSGRLEPVEAFLGVKYGSATRFGVAGSVPRWTSTKLADSQPPVCPQTFPDLSNKTAALQFMPKNRYAFLKRLAPLLANQTEDCLYLNIYVPGSAKIIGCLDSGIFITLLLRLQCSDSLPAPDNLPPLRNTKNLDFGGASGAIPRASTPNPRPKAKKVKSLSKAAILDVDDLASELETELGAWELWASTPKNIDIGPAAKVGSLIDNLKRKVIDPLLRGYSDLVNELAFHRKISSGITRISSSMDQIDRIVGRFDGGPLHTEVEDESSKVIALGLVRLEQALLAKFDALSTKVDNVVDKTDKVQGKLEKVVREDITNLGRKIDVLNYKQKEVAENTAALGARSLLKQNTPKTSKDKTGKTKFASDKTDTDTDSKRKRPETDVDTDGDSDALWTPVTRKRRTNGGGLGGGGASPRLVTTAAEAPNPRTKKLTKKAKKRQKNLKIEYENILTNNKRRASIPKLPTLVISKPRPNEIPLGSELESDHSYRDALMSPKSLRREMRAVVDPGRLGLSVKGVVPLGVDKLKVTVTSEDQKEKLTRELRSHNFELREDRPRTRSLMVRIHRVDRTIPQEDVARMAFEQNPWVRELFKDLSEWKEEFIPSFRKGKRELDDVIWVTRVTSRVRDELLKRTFIFIGFDVCTISDFIDITQCRKCLGFGHPESKCRGQTVCSTCAGSHEAKACTAGNGIKVCHNCKSQGLKQINHSPCGLDCPVYMKVWRREMRAVGPL
ncbi:hypothetical protein GE061_009822 [Apolygus lucorum]|uniref:Carboxylesterase type B domain-containing protein n=1 Tax=Apolygus lucorum TaxID=248454 RepID=A0A8S9Y1L6_APOLU|nr:hypothetical protein GE061_009822 [Apolygus lucorum]